MSKQQKQWEVRSERSFGEDFDGLIDVLLQNRHIETKEDREMFLHPDLAQVTTKTVGVDQKQLKKALKRIRQAIEQQEQIVVFGDYDVDGVTGCTILWESLHGLKAKVMPYIPHRQEEGYGLSVKGIMNIQKQLPETKLIVTVDNGIVANEAVVFANEQGIEVIITDHHVASDILPEAFAIVHTTQLCGAGVAYLFMQELKQASLPDPSLLELAALGTVADLVPLTLANRVIVSAGITQLRQTKRIGLLALFRVAGIQKDELGVYAIGYQIGPRLNAAGRIDSAMESLRLLCTKNKARAEALATKLELLNRERQQLLKESSDHAVAIVEKLSLHEKKILIIGHETYAEGVIGLVAGRLVEAFYRPAIVLSLGKERSKASVRSVRGFDIIAFLREHSERFINVGGHPMAAGFTIETETLADLQQTLEAHADEAVTDDVLIRALSIDCELPFSALTRELYQSLQSLAPFGMGNPEPVFMTKGVIVQSIRAIGKDATHLKLKLKQKGSDSFDAIAFGFGELISDIAVGDAIAVAYVLDENTWNGETTLQLKVRDIQKSSS
jgi:single-stranded-DNA-specific exonuclease